MRAALPPRPALSPCKQCCGLYCCHLGQLLDLDHYESRASFPSAEAHQRIVHRRVSVGVELAQHLAHHTRALPASGRQAKPMHLALHHSSCCSGGAAAQHSLCTCRRDPMSSASLLCRSQAPHAMQPRSSQQPTAAAPAHLNGLLCCRPSSCIANRMRRCTGFRPSRTSGRARPTMTDMAYWGGTAGGGRKQVGGGSWRSRARWPGPRVAEQAMESLCSLPLSSFQAMPFYLPRSPLPSRSPTGRIAPPPGAAPSQ